MNTARSLGAGGAGRLAGRVEAVNTARSLVVGGGGPTTRESRGGEHSEVTWCGWRRADYQGEQRR